jgi:hypothetical protein
MSKKPKYTVSDARWSAALVEFKCTTGVGQLHDIADVALAALDPLRRNSGASVRDPQAPAASNRALAAVPAGGSCGRGTRHTLGCAQHH